jgi:hypothetical protein
MKRDWRALRSFGRGSMRSERLTLVEKKIRGPNRVFKVIGTEYDSVRDCQIMKPDVAYSVFIRGHAILKEAIILSRYLLVAEHYSSRTLVLLR